MRGRAGRALGVLVLLGLVAGAGITVLQLGTRTPVADPWFDIGLAMAAGSARLGVRLGRGRLPGLLAADAAQTAIVSGRRPGRDRRHGRSAGRGSRSGVHARPRRTPGRPAADRRTLASHGRG